MNAIELFNKQYDLQTYNCAHFAIEVFKLINGVDISEQLSSFTKQTRKADITKLKQFVKIPEAEHGCLILFHAHRNAPHVGICYYGKCLHIGEQGVKLESLEVASIGFKRIGFYKL